MRLDYMHWYRGLAMVYIIARHSLTQTLDSSTPTARLLEACYSTAPPCSCSSALCLPIWRRATSTGVHEEKHVLLPIGGVAAGILPGVPQFSCTRCCRWTMCRRR